MTVRGAPVLFRVVVDGVPEAPMRPGSARFVPDGSESFSYSFVGRTAPFEADDTHRFNVQWRSPTGATVTLQHGVLNLLFQRGKVVRGLAMMTAALERAAPADQPWIRGMQEEAFALAGESDRRTAIALAQDILGKGGQ